MAQELLPDDLGKVNQAVRAAAGYIGGVNRSQQGEDGSESANTVPDNDALIKAVLIAGSATLVQAMVITPETASAIVNGTTS